MCPVPHSITSSAEQRDVKYCFEDIRETLLDANSKDVRKAKARLDELREKRKAEQLEEMEQKAAERRQAEEQRLKEAKENGTKQNGNGAGVKNGAAR
jgi:flagellar biosynthesis/type III secretory pathway protein FliH